MKHTLWLVLLSPALVTLGMGAEEGPTAERVADPAEHYQSALETAERGYLAARIRAHEAVLQRLAAEGSSPLDQETVEEWRALAARVRKSLALDRERVHLLLPPALFAFEGRGFERKVLRDAANAFSNRRYVWRGVPPRFDRWGFLQIAGGDTPDITLEVRRGGVVCAVSASAASLAKEGWVVHPGVRWSYSDRGKTRVVLATRRVEAGERIRIPHYGWAGTTVLLPPDRS